MRRIARVDRNQAQITAALRKIGASVQPIHTVGMGVPDLLIGFRSKNYLMECKAGKEKLTQMEADWMAGWKGQCCVVRSPEEAILTVAGTQDGFVANNSFVPFPERSYVLAGGGGGGPTYHGNMGGHGNKGGGGGKGTYVIRRIKRGKKQKVQNN